MMPRIIDEGRVVGWVVSNETKVMKDGVLWDKKILEHLEKLEK